MKLGSIEKDKQPSQEILRLFEKTRVAYLSAAQDPDEYGGRWRNAVDSIIESYEELDAAGKELKNFIDEKDLNDKDTILGCPPESWIDNLQMSLEYFIDIEEYEKCSEVKQLLDKLQS